MKRLLATRFRAEGDRVGQIYSKTSPCSKPPDKTSTSIAVLALFAAFWFALLAGSGALFSGYQLEDDHEILRMNRDLSSSHSLVSVAHSWISRDLGIRFRPIYYLHRVLETAVFGTNFLYWSLWNCLLAALTSFFLYRFSRLLGWPFHASIVFSLLALTGPQAAIWWRRGPAETPGAFLASLSLQFLAHSVHVQRSERVFRVLFCLSAVAMSLCKESFALLLPAMAFLCVWLTHESDKTSWLSAVKRKLWLIVFLIGVVITVVTVLIFGIQKTSIGYAGVDSFDRGALVGMLRTLYRFGKLNELTIVTLMLGILVICSIDSERRLSLASLAFLQDFIPVIALAVLWIAPQIVLYAKSGVYERYLMPVSLGVSFLCVWTYLYLRHNLPHFGKAALFVILLYTFYAIAFPMMRGASRFASRSRDVSSLFGSMPKSIASDGRVLIVADPKTHYEWSYSCLWYLTLKQGFKEDDVYIHYQSASPEITPALRQIAWFGGRTLGSLNDRKTISDVIILPGMENMFVSGAGDWIRSSSFERQVFSQEKDRPGGGFVLYSRKRG